MKYKQYVNMKTGETVFEEDAFDYAMDQLGIKIEGKGIAGSYNQEQIDFIVEFTNWYFSGNWVLEEVEELYEETEWDYYFDKGFHKEVI